MAWEASDEVVGVGGGGPGGWGEEQPTSWWDRAKGVGQSVNDAVRAGANAATFGMADRLAGLTGGGTDAQVKLSEQARNRSPIASAVGDVGGSLAIPGMGGAGLAARLGSGPAARALGFGLEGAGVGAAQGAGNTYTGKLEDYVKNAVKGGAMGGVFGGIGGAAFAPRPPVSSARVPTVGEQGRATDIAYDALRANQAAYSAQHFGDAGNQLEQRLLNQGYIPNYSPGSFTAVDRMRAQQGNPNAVVTPANIDLIRQGINRIPRNDTAQVDRASGRIVKNALDDFLVNPPAGSIRPGTQADAAIAAHQADTARRLAAGEARAQKMANMREAAENQAASSWSGLNVENNIRNQVKNFINPNTGGRERLAGYNAEERVALRDIVHRGGVANVGRWTGNILGGGGGVAVPVAMMAGNEFVKQNPELSIAAPAAGLALRALSNRSARNTIGRAEDLISRRNPLYEARAANAPMVPGPSALSAGDTSRMRNVLTEALLENQREPLRITVTPRKSEEEE